MNTTEQFVILKNMESCSIDKIPIISYSDFYQHIIFLMKDPQFHCVNYFAMPNEEGLFFYCCMADDSTNTIQILSHVLSTDKKKQLLSLTKEVMAFHVYERELAENFGIEFIYNPWDKPLRYATNRFDKTKTIENYPFYKIESDELHEVGVGPIHAGVIEPGHFRFLCNGENVLHLEIQLGYQHRGVEALFLTKSTFHQQNILAESIAGDTTIGHGLAFVSAIEALGNIQSEPRLQLERAIALELERIAIHVGDLSALCVDVAYQFGSAVFGALRTPVINYLQRWCGNRFGKNLIRIGGTHYPLTDELIQSLKLFLDDFEPRFTLMAKRMFDLPSVQVRFENIGGLTPEQTHAIGAVGMAARMNGHGRDIRKSHPFAAFQQEAIDTFSDIKSGDVWARAMVRKKEIEASIIYIRKLILTLSSTNDSSAKPLPEKEIKLTPNSFTISLTEGWRGEICHCALSNTEGKLSLYKVKDPSLHNWMALALSLRDLEISDFPVNNKSYNLSYCGHDL